MKTIHVTDEESRSAAQAAIALTAPPFTVVIGGDGSPLMMTPRTAAQLIFGSIVRVAQCMTFGGMADGSVSSLTVSPPITAEKSDPMAKETI